MGDFIWAYLIHLGYNMWGEPEIQDGYYEGAPKIRSYVKKTDKNVHYFAQPYLRFDLPLWRDIANRAAKNGVNMFVIDVAEGLQYESHPEISCKGALSKAELSSELSFLRSIGIEPIPKLNFSSCHDMWLGQYTKMRCTPVYYKVCSDLIQEVCELFDNPRLFHIGMDEEDAAIRVRNAAFIRQGDLWWHDFKFFVNQVEKNGARAWMWSDYMWHYPELFFENMSKEVLQSNWYYRTFDVENLQPEILTRLNAFNLLAEKGFDQVPTGSNWRYKDNLSNLAEYLKKEIDTTQIKGFLQTVWAPTLPDSAEKHYEAIDDFIRATKLWNE